MRNLKTTISPDMAPFWDIIVKLRYSYDASDLDDTLKLLLGEQAPTKAFLVKMEIMKLSQKTLHAIDLRDFFKGQCKPVEVGGITHYLDEESEKLLKLETKQYGNRLTVGAVELVLADAKKRIKTTPTALLKNEIPEAQILSLTRFYKRKEERIYFTKKVKLYYEDPDFLNEKERRQIGIEGTTTNISNTGISVRFKKHQLPVKKGEVFIHMHEVEREYTFPGEVIVPYRIIKTVDKNDSTYAMLEIIPNEDNKNTVEFLRFSENYIRTQRGKYRISVENTEEAVNIKMNEQFVVTRLDSLPIYFSREIDSWHVKAQLNTENNSHVGRIGNRENNNEFVAALSKLKYLQHYLNSEKPFMEFLFVFPLTLDSRSAFVAVPSREFYKRPNIIKLALEAKEKKQLKLYRIEGSILDPENEHYIPTSLPDNVVNKLNCKNREPAGITKEFAKSLERMVNISDITDSIDTLQLLNNIKLSGDLSVKQNEIKPFTLMVPKEMPKIQESRSESNDFRIEERFIHKTKALVRKKGSSISSEVSGFTDNISSRGLRVKLDKASDFQVGDELIVSLPTLKTSSGIIFKNQPYKVVGKVDEQDIRLNIQGNPREHHGRKIMQKYIYENIEIMTYMDIDKEMQGLSRILRNLFTANVHSNYGIISRKESTRYIRNILVSEKKGLLEINSLTDKKKAFKDLMRDETVRSAISRRDSVINKANPYETFHVLVMPRKKSSGHVYQVTKVIENLSKKHDIKGMFENTGRLGEYKLLRIKATKKGRVLNKYFADELDYLSRYSSAKANRIESAIRETTGVIEVSDLSYLIKAQFN